QADLVRSYLVGTHGGRVGIGLGRRGPADIRALLPRRPELHPQLQSSTGLADRRIRQPHRRHQRSPRQYRIPHPVAVRHQAGGVRRHRERVRLQDEVRSDRPALRGRGWDPLGIAVRADPRRLRLQSQPEAGREALEFPFFSRFTVLRRGGMKAAIVSLVALAAVTVFVSGAAAQTPTQAPAPAPAPAPAAAPAAGAASTIGYSHVQRVRARSAAGVAAREQLEKERATIQKDMDGRRQELEKLRDEMEKKGALMTADARREKQEAFERKRRDAARAADDYQKELEK